MSLCQTDITYNEVTIRNVLTESVEMSPTYDSTNVDPVGIHTTVVFTGDLHTSDVDQEIHGSRVNWSKADGVGLAPGLHDTLRKFLQPRHEFKMTINDEVLFLISPDATAPCGEPSGKRDSEGGMTTLGVIEGYDISHGPRTKCQILAIKGTRTAKCRFTVEFVALMRCGTDPVGIGDILNMRWVVADDIDCKSWLTRRMYQGRIRFRSRALSINPHVLARNFAFPPILRGFKRESVSYHEDPNALELTFSIIDQETWAAAPAPATSWEGTYTMSFPQYGVSCEQELNLLLRSDKSVSKRLLVTLAMYILEAKVHWEWIRTNSPGTIFLQSSTLQENLAENEIRFNARVISIDANAWVMNVSKFKGSGGGFDFGSPLRPDVSHWTRGIVNPRDRMYDKELVVVPKNLSAAASILLSILQNPCCPKNLSQPPTGVTGADIPAYTTTPQVDATQLEQFTSARYSESHQKAAYSFYKMSSSLSSDTGWRGFPLGKQCSASSSEATVAFAHLHCPIQIRKVTIHASRVNAWPELIKPVHWKDPNTNIVHVLKHYTIDPSPVQLSADGRDAMHEVIATYWYYLDRPYNVGPGYKLAVGRLPYVTKNPLVLGAYTPAGSPGNHPDPDGSAIDEQFFLNPSDLLAAAVP